MASYMPLTTVWEGVAVIKTIVALLGLLTIVILGHTFLATISFYLRLSVRPLQRLDISHSMGNELYVQSVENAAHLPGRIPYFLSNLPTWPKKLSFQANRIFITVAISASDKTSCYQFQSRPHVYAIPLYPF